MAARLPPQAVIDCCLRRTLLLLDEAAHQLAACTVMARSWMPHPQSLQSPPTDCVCSSLAPTDRHFQNRLHLASGTPATDAPSSQVSWSTLQCASLPFPLEQRAPPCDHVD